MVTFVKGNIVEWESQAAGYWKRKRGEVVEIVPAGVVPRWMPSSRKPGMARDHESYIIHVRGAGRYWPRVSALKHAK